MRKDQSIIVKLTIVLLFVTLFLFGFIQARNFLYPILMAILIAYLLYPFASFLEKHKFPRILANLLSIIFGMIIIGGGIYFVYTQISIFVQDLPALRKQAVENISQLERFIEARTGISTIAQQQWIEARIYEIFESGSQMFGTAFTATTGTITRIGFMPVYVFFMLYYRDKFKKFILLVVPDEKHEKTENILDDVSYVTEKYMSGVFAVVLILCVLNSIGLLIVGINYAILFGIISALFNFIPYFGTLIGGLVPLAYTLLLSPYPEKVIGVIIYFAIIQFTENNILTPNITGGNVQLNPFITILSIILGGMLWGLPGMFLIVPFLAMFKIFCGYFEPLQPFAFLLGTEGAEEHSLTREKIVKFFRRNKVEEDV
jgi:predicted PurR-regulated permease PerM